MAGRYRLEKVLGMGGMGYVVSATQVAPDGPSQLVAIKFMLPEAMKSASLHRRFVREAEAIGRLRSEHVCRLLDSGRLPDGAPFMVMEHLSGEDLGRVVSARGPLPLWEAADYTLQILDAIAEAHSQGIIHRDLKPANIFRAQVGEGGAVIKVLDFGVAKAADGLYSTATDTVIGSPAFMAPEQILSSKRVDGRADVYSIGAILYFLLTGRPPLNADQLPALCFKVLSEDPAPPSLYRPELPAEVDDVVLMCMTRDQRHRLPNVAELAFALLPFAPERCRPLADAVFRSLSYTPGRWRRRLMPARPRGPRIKGRWQARSNRFATLLVQDAALAISPRTSGLRRYWLGGIVAIGLGLGAAAATKLARGDGEPASSERAGSEGAQDSPPAPAPQPPRQEATPARTSAAVLEAAPGPTASPPIPVLQSGERDVQTTDPGKRVKSRQRTRGRPSSPDSRMPARTGSAASAAPPVSPERDRPKRCAVDDPLCAFGTAR